MTRSHSLSTRPAPTPPASGRLPLRWVVSDALAVTGRNLLRYRRIPTLLLFSTIQPVMFVLLFAYVFGGAIDIPGVDYINYLMPGIFAQTVIFGSTQTGVALADDLQKGIVDRFRSLPMARSAVLAGRTLSDSVRNLFVVLLMTGVGTLIGFRFQGGLLGALACIALALGFGFAFMWISAFIGLSVRDVESAQAAGFVWVFPLVFASSAFVPTRTMPAALQAFARVQPVSVTVDAMRGLALGTATTGDVLAALAWIGGILAVFVPLAVRGYQRAA
jgi:ABC transporter DrrB family efflux protein